MAEQKSEDLGIGGKTTIWSLSHRKKKASAKEVSSTLLTIGKKQSIGRKNNLKPQYI